MVVALTLVGACIGSFLNVVAYRMPRECMSVSRPRRSRCPRCANWIAWYDNLPVVSWLALGGKCRGCRVGISPRYPLVEVAVAALFAGLIFAVVPAEARLTPMEHGQDWLRYGVVVLVTSAVVALALIDLDYRILPDEITKTGIVVGPVLAFLAPGVQPDQAFRVMGGDGLGLRVDALLNGVVGAVASAGTLWLIGYLGSKAFRKPAMGFGDVKMIGAMGGIVGIWALLALMLAAFAGAAIGLLKKVVTRDSYIPFGPFLGFGLIVVMVTGDATLRWWLRILGPA